MEHWIKFRKGLFTEPEVLILANTLKISVDEVIGKLARLWCWADSASRNGHVLGVTRNEVVSLIGCDRFVTAVENVGWLSQKEGGIFFPNFERHMGKSAKARANATERKRKSRKNGHALSVTKTGPEKRREEKRREEVNKPPNPLRGELVSGVEIPEKWDPEITKKLLSEWVEYRAQLKKPIRTTSSLQRLLKKFDSHLELSEALDHSIANGYQGLFAPKQSRPNGALGGDNNYMDLLRLEGKKAGIK